jgi:2-desacetyl-2-hydroxyethyl bacteriochlorophyllide A dehydrogenase
MKAVALDDRRQHALVDLQVPQAGPGEVLVRSAFCGICGTDLHAAEIELFKTGVVVGHEFSGEIVETGPGVTGWRVGQLIAANPNGRVCRVCRYCQEGRYNLCHSATILNPLGVAVNGGMAEYVALHTDYLRALPESMSAQHGAWVEPLAVAVRSVRTSPVRIGDDVAIIGGGPVGQLVLQLLRRAGAKHIVMVEPSAYRRDLAERLGADLTITPEQAGSASAAGDLREAAHVFECSGHPTALNLALSLVAAGGSIRLVGMAPRPITFDPVLAITREVQILTGFIYVDEFERAVELLAAGLVDVDSLTSSVTPMAGFAQAFDSLRQPESSMKVLISTSDGDGR